jgi:triacylglycerol esterase/lipase EstA (alpha/beta hydrolase family)
MIFKTLLIIATLFFTACGGGGDKSEDLQTNLLEQSGQPTPTPTPTQTQVKPETKKETKTVTIYIHGYDKDGSKSKDVYGEVNQDEVVDNLSQIANLPTLQNYDKNNFTQVLAVATYYGSQPPSYYTQQDITEVENSEKGIPRYALIMAKFAKHTLELTGAEKLNIVSGSMGSLVTRYMIEKNLQNLASEKKIEKWLSIEGVIRGNYAASNSISSLLSLFKKKNIDEEQMDYDWVKKNLGGFEASSPYYKDITLGFMSSTQHNTHGAALDGLLSINGQLQPNDGVQLLKDTIFDKTPHNTPTYNRFYTDHLGIKKHQGAWAEVATFLTPNKHVRITLIEAQVHDLHENIGKNLNHHADMVFQSEVTSQKVLEKFNIKEPISQRKVEGGALNLIKYDSINQIKPVNQTIFDDFILKEEQTLHINISAFELDKYTMYDVREPTLKSSKDKIGDIALDIPLKDDIIDISVSGWSGKIKVEVLP